MIIGYNYFGKGMEGNVFDTAIPTGGIDEVIMGAGIYDELYITLDKSVGSVNQKPSGWQLKTIMNAKFENDLEAGSLDSDGHKITGIQIYRRKYLEESKWLLVGQFPYELEYNAYAFVDRFTENGATYEYAIVPIAEKVIGDITISEPVKVEYDGVFISDLTGNYHLDVDYELGQVTHNKNMNVSSPLNGRFPIVTQGVQDYRTGDIKFLPLSREQVGAGGQKIEGKIERAYRNKVLEFLRSGGSKVIRDSNGEMMIVATHNVTSTSRNGGLAELHDVSFSFTEVGEFDFDTMSKGGLIGSAGKSKYSFDDFGNVIWGMNLTDETDNKFRRTYRSSLSGGLNVE